MITGPATCHFVGISEMASDRLQDVIIFIAVQLMKEEGKIGTEDQRRS
jgi:hypothetical protein